MATSTTPADPPSTARYEILRERGRGSTGVVFEAWDRTRQVPVAVKTLRKREADALYRLKKEFRALSDISHPNLVAFYELEAEGDQWMLSMELVDGEPLVQWVRQQDPTAHRPRSGSDSTMDVFSVAESTDEVLRVETTDEQARPGLVRDMARLRSAFRQLAEAVGALHAAGRLHRDLKPSNVLVNARGRVVVLDFDLVSELLSPQGEVVTNRGLGTVAYMAPEQIVGGALTPAADWYAVGAILYEALTGARPFEGNLARVLTAKQVEEPQPPVELCAGVPRDLDELCRDLLRMDPRERPRGDEVVRRLGGTMEVGLRAGPLVGREEPLATLRRAWEDLDEGAVLVRVRGRSGIGKSFLVEHFLTSLPEQTTVLRGRCFEREAIPYNAFDSLVDGLSQVLLATEDCAARIDPDVAALARLFPSLRRVPAVAALPEVDIPDEHALRRRGFAALVRLVAGFAPAVVYLDDVHWGDVDSAYLLRELLTLERPVLVVLTFRSEEEAASRFLEVVRRIVKESGIAAQTIDISDLAPTATRSLAAALLGEEAPGEVASRIARESAGSPLFVEVLARHVLEHQEQGAPVPDLETAIVQRVSGLPAAARCFVELLGVAGRPLEPDLAGRAAGIGDVLRVVDWLRTSRFIRTAGEGVDVYHDRVRHAVLAQLEPGDLRDRHRRLATAIDQGGSPDHEALMRHWAGAGEPLRAAPHALEAARMAATSLAFDRAAALCQRALDLGEWDEAERASLRERYARMLANAGRPEEAGRAYLAAAEGDQPRIEVLELRRLAAEQYLGGGYIDQGLAIATELFREMGLRLHRNPVLAFVAMLWTRARLRRRGLDLEPATGPQDPEDSFRVDLCRSISEGTNLSDVVQSHDLILRALYYALQAGDPRRTATGLMHLGVVYAAGSQSDRERIPDVRRRVDEAIALCDRDLPQLEAELETGLCAAAYVQGHFAEAVERGLRAEKLLLERFSAATWLLNTARQMVVWSLSYQGRFRELMAEAPRMIADAEARGDLRFLASVPGVLVWLVAVSGRVDEAFDIIEENERRWSKERFQLQHYSSATTRTHLHLYQGDSAEAWREWLQTWPRLRRSMLMANRFVRLEAWQFNGRIALARYRQSGDRRALRSVRRSLRKLAADPAEWSTPIAIAVEALVEDGPGTIDGLRRSLEGFERAGMAMFAAAARVRLGERIGGEEGDALVADGMAFMREQLSTNPEALARTLLWG